MTLCFNELSACCSLFLLKTDGRKEMLKLKTVMSHASLLFFFLFFFFSGAGECPVGITTDECHLTKKSSAALYV